MSFSVSFTLYHHDRVALLPDLNNAGMGQENERDKPPYAVKAGVFTEGWYLLQAERDRPQVGLDVRLVTP